MHKQQQRAQEQVANQQYNGGSYPDGPIISQNDPVMNGNNQSYGNQVSVPASANPFIRNNNNMVIPPNNNNMIIPPNNNNQFHQQQPPNYFNNPSSINNPYNYPEPYPQNPYYNK